MGFFPCEIGFSNVSSLIISSNYTLIHYFYIPFPYTNNTDLYNDALRFKATLCIKRQYAFQIRFLYLTTLSAAPHS